MKHLFVLAIVIMCMHTLSVAQPDTTIVYFSNYEETTKDRADSYIQFYRQDNLWHGKQYLIKNGILKSEGNYREKKYDKRVGTFKNYSEKGVLKSIAVYDDTSKSVERTYFYENGYKQSWIHYADKGKNEQMCWDEAGNEKADCDVEKEARFKGGAEGWKKYLEKNLNAGIAADAGAPEGYYTVTVQFIVNKEGVLSRIRPTSVPAACKPCAAEVVSVLTNGPNWEPATINGEPVLYQAIQKVTFVVEGQRKGRKN